MTGHDWKRADREDARKLSWALLGVGIAAAVLGLVGVIWGVAAGDSGRLIDGAVELVVGLLITAAVAIRLRGRSKQSKS